MFSFTRTVIDLIQSATGLKVKPNTSNMNVTKNHNNMDSSTQQRKNHTPIIRTPYTSIGHSLTIFKNSIVAAQDLDTEHISTNLIEEDFVFALQRYCAYFTLQNGQEVIIRPILPNDMSRMKEILQNGEISQQSLSLRFNTITTTVKDSVLRYFTSIDYDRHFAIVGLVKENGVWKGVATARFIQDLEDPSTAEWSAIVLDQYHGIGIGSCLLYYISYMASQCDINRLCAVVHCDNYPVLHWMKKLSGYQLFFNGSRYWFFDTPIYPSWMRDAERQKAVENAAKGESVLNDQVLDVLRTSVRDLCKSEFILTEVKRKSWKRSSIPNKKRTVPSVTFVNSMEGDCDFEDLF